MARRLKAVFHILFLAIATWIAPSSSMAQDWPARPVTLVVPFSAGGLSDVYGPTICGEAGYFAAAEGLRLEQAFFKIPDPIKRAELIKMAEDYVRGAQR